MLVGKLILLFSDWAASGGQPEARSFCERGPVLGGGPAGRAGQGLRDAARRRER